MKMRSYLIEALVRAGTSAADIPADVAKLLEAHNGEALIRMRHKGANPEHAVRKSHKDIYGAGLLARNIRVVGKTPEFEV